MKAPPWRLTIVGAAEAALMFCRGSGREGGLSGDTASAAAATPAPLKSASTLPEIARAADVVTALAGPPCSPSPFPVATPLLSAEGDESPPHAISASEMVTSNVSAFI